MACVRLLTALIKTNVNCVIWLGISREIAKIRGEQLPKPIIFSILRTSLLIPLVVPLLLQLPPVPLPLTPFPLVPLLPCCCCA